jgi:hypothetical protein
MHQEKAHGAAKTELGSWELEASEDVPGWQEHSASTNVAKQAPNDG